MASWFLPESLGHSGCAESICYSDELCVLPLDALHWHPWETEHPCYLVSRETPGSLEIGGDHIELPAESVLPVGAGVSWYVPNGFRHALTLLVARKPFDLSVRLTLGLCPEIEARHGPSAYPQQLPALLDEFQNETAENLAESRVVGHAIALLILVEILKSCYPLQVEGTICGEGLREPRRPEIQRALKMIRANYVAGVSVEELARVANLSRSYFVRAFHDEIGATPHQYLLRMRVLKVRELLLTMPSADMSTIASLSGFAGPSQLHRAFRSLTGLTPAQYRHSCET